MIRALQVSLLILLLALIVLACVFSWVLFSLAHTVAGVREDLNQQETALVQHAETALDQVTYSADHFESAVTRPCHGAAGPDACGSLAQLNKTVIKAGDAVVTTQRAELRFIQPSVNAARAVGAAAIEIGAAAKSLSGTADEATTTLAELNDETTGILPMLGAYREAGGNLNAIAKAFVTAKTPENVNRFVVAAAGTAENVQGITAGVKVETDAMVAPKTRKQRVMEFAPPVFKLGVTALCVFAGPC